MPGGERRELSVSKEKLDRDIALLVAGLRARGAVWRAVVGVANGGVYPGGKVADLLNLDYREMRVSSYDGKVKSAPRIVRALDDPDHGQGLLIVDDVVDSGDTALVLRQNLPKADFLSVYAKADGLAKLERHGETHICAERYPQDVWIVFPWHQESWDNEVPRSFARYRQTTR